MNRFSRLNQSLDVFQSGNPQQRSFGLQSGNAVQQAYSQRAAGELALQAIFSNQIAYQQAQAIKRQLRRERQLAAIAQRKAAAARDAAAQDAAPKNTVENQRVAARGQ